MNIQYGKGYYPGVEKIRIGGLTEIVSYDDTQPPTLNQRGSGYNYIINPKSGRHVLITGKIGKSIIRNYMKYLFKSV